MTSFHRWAVCCLAFLLVIGGLAGQQKVDTHEGVEIGGINQWIGTKGTDDSKPLLLFLHGGPGFSARGYGQKFVKHLKDDFIVALWDQRGAGITKAWNNDSSPISLELMQADTKEVVDYLLAKFGKKKLYLVGFSWGGFLGHDFANKYPDLLHAYISVSSMIHQQEAERMALEMLRERVASSGSKEAQREITQIRLPIAEWEHLYYHRKWTTYFVEGKSAAKKFPPALFKNWADRWLSLYAQAAAINYFETAPEINCPIYFFTSHGDYVAHYKLIERYYGQVKSPRKEIVWFDEAGHEIPSQRPRIFSEAVIKIARQLN